MAAVHDLSRLATHEQCTVSNALALIERIVKADRLLAVVELQDATKAGADPKKLAQDWKELEKGEEALTRADWFGAIEHYRNAWHHAAHLLAKVVVHPTNGGVRLEFLALPGQTYLIQASTNLADWFMLGTGVAGPDGTVTLDDEPKGSSKVRFYRAVLEP